MTREHRITNCGDVVTAVFQVEEQPRRTRVRLRQIPLTRREALALTRLDELELRKYRDSE
jgi:hypothetical protein